MRSSIHVPTGPGPAVNGPARNRWRCSQRANGPQSWTSTKRKGGSNSRTITRHFTETPAMRPARLYGGEISRVGEEVEHVGARPRQPETPLDDVVGHDERAIIGGCSVPVKRAPTRR